MLLYQLRRYRSGEIRGQAGVSPSARRSPRRSTIRDPHVPRTVRQHYTGPSPS